MRNNSHNYDANACAPLYFIAPQDTPSIPTSIPMGIKILCMFFSKGKLCKGN